MMCKLCQQSVPNLINSHIIPEFMYKKLYDEHHRFFGLSLDPDVDDRYVQKGIREPLLCPQCDNVLLAGYEKYFSGLLYGGVEHRSAIGKKELRLRDLDYSKVRLFFLSLLWRMSVASHAFFYQVSLGPHEEVLRRMLLGGDPGEPEEYGVLCIAPMFTGSTLGNVVAKPDWVRSGGNRTYRCLFGGFLYCFVVGRSTVLRPVAERFIQKDGSWVIRQERFEDVPFLLDLCVQTGKAIHERRAQGRGLL